VAARAVVELWRYRSSSYGELHKHLLSCRTGRWYDRRRLCTWEDKGLEACSVDRSTCCWGVLHFQNITAQLMQPWLHNFEVHVRGVMQSCPCDRTRLKISGDNPAHFQLRRLMVCRRSFFIRHKYRRPGSYDETRLATALRHSHSSQGHDSIKLWPR
jgi:hypothetical protein